MAYNSGVKTLLREAVSWGAVIVVGFGFVYYFDDLRGFATRMISTVAEHPSVNPSVSVSVQDPVSNEDGFERSVTLKAGRNGHFYTRANVNGRDIAVLVDTGATTVALTYEDADRLGLRPRDSDFTHSVGTANGTGLAATVALDSIRIGDVEVRNVRGMVLEPGKLGVTLLGMEFIRKLERFELSGDELVLVE